ncbi:MAG TPA: FHA domain-containing protein [Vicinamibacterales bacterium]|nr:FHA domain-containing protein [Vicinamibacterales bacterium]
MAKIVLRFGDQVLKEYELGAHALKIGRLPDNTVVIDNPAVSSHHARIVHDSGKFVIEDLKSTNGTFINERRVHRQVLENGDTVLIGKHKLVYDAAGGESVADTDSAEVDTAPSKLEGGTVFLDTKQQRELLAKMGIDLGTSSGPSTVKGGSTAADARGPSGGQKTTALRVGVLRVLSGKSDQSEYLLNQATSIIGSADTAAVKLKGWFKPKSAVAIARKGETYTLTALGGKQTVNNEPLTGRRDLKEGDILMVSGLTLEFRYKA